MKNCFIVLLLILNSSMLSITASAEENVLYISDVLYVPVRSGKGDQYRILHKGLKSGTPVVLIEQDEESGFSLIKIDDETTGWLRTRYLSGEPTAQIKLDAIIAEKQALLADGNSAESQISNLQAELESVKVDKELLLKNNQEIQAKLEKLTQLSGNVISINDKNKKLVENNQLLQTHVDSLEAEIEQQNSNETILFFISGSILVLATLLINSWLESIRRSRSYSSWG